MTRKYVYSDFSLGFDVLATGTFNLQTNEDAINQSIVTILSTMPGERIMYPTFGSIVPELVFSDMDDMTAADIKQNIDKALSQWENRIQLTGVSVNADVDNNWYKIDIKYVIIASGQQGTFSGKIDVPTA